MRTITKEELQEILEKHKMWLNDNGGEKADLRNADLREANLRDADLQHADLRGTDLNGADLKEAELSDADLRHANLRGANLQHASLHCTNLQYANLEEANLHCVDLYQADLRYTWLHSVDLRGANLFGTDLRGVYSRWLIHAGAIGSRRAEALYFADRDMVNYDGCWNGTLAEFKELIDEVCPANDEKYFIYRAEYISAIKMFESLRQAYLKKRNGGNE